MPLLAHVQYHCNTHNDNNNIHSTLLHSVQNLHAHTHTDRLRLEGFEMSCQVTTTLIQPQSKKETLGMQLAVGKANMCICSVYS